MKYFTFINNICAYKLQKFITCTVFGDWKDGNGLVIWKFQLFILESMVKSFNSVITNEWNQLFRTVMVYILVIILMLHINGLSITYQCSDFNI